MSAPALARIRAEIAALEARVPRTAADRAALQALYARERTELWHLPRRIAAARAKLAALERLAA